MFTESQRRALLAVLLICAAAFAHRMIKLYMVPSPRYDFTALDEAFRRRADSLLQLDTAQQHIEKNAPGPSTLRPALYPININQADVPTLVRLPRIGPALARRIVDYRRLHGPFQRKEDLLQVSGIGPKTLARIDSLITVE